MSSSSIFSTTMNHHFWALKALEFNFQPLFLILNQQIFISSTFPSKNSHKFHFHNHKFHIFEFLHWWIVKGVSFCSYLEFGRLKWLETSFTPEKVTIYMIFINFHICAAIADCFLCQRLCVDLWCSLHVNAHVRFAIDQIVFFCNTDLSSSLRLYLWQQKQKFR